MHVVERLDRLVLLTCQSGDFLRSLDKMVSVDAVGAHLYICMCSEFVRLEGNFSLIFVFILLDSVE